MKALGGIFLERPDHERFQCIRHTVSRHTEWRQWLVLDRVEDRFCVRAFEGHFARQHLVQHDAERPDVAAQVGVLTACLLGRHVRDGADGGSGHGQLERVRELRETEIDDLDAVVGDN